MTRAVAETLEVAERDEHGHLHQGLFSPLIERNTIVPVSREGTYFPIQDDQTQLKLEVYQGESPRVANNIKLGQLQISLPRAKAQENPVRVRFTFVGAGMTPADGATGRSSISGRSSTTPQLSMVVRPLLVPPNSRNFAFVSQLSKLPMTWCSPSGKARNI